MATISIGNNRIAVNTGQSVLDALLSVGTKVPYSCRAGVCQSCITQAIDGEPPDIAQAGLKETLKQQNFFLACRCYPDQDLVIENFELDRCGARVEKLIQRSANVLEVHLVPDIQLNYQAGQFITLWCDRPGEDVEEGRCYSLSSLPTEDESLIIQIAKVEGGYVSTWAHEQLSRGQQLVITKPTGNCFFAPEHVRQSILLAATGTGLAPIYGILRDALERKHLGEINLLHSAKCREELYLHKALRNLEAAYPQLRYHEIVSDSYHNDSCSNMDIEEKIAHEWPRLNNWQVYLCGNPRLVQKMRKQVFLAGASSQQIFSDAFLNRHDGLGIK